MGLQNAFVNLNDQDEGLQLLKNRPGLSLRYME